MDAAASAGDRAPSAGDTAFSRVLARRVAEHFDARGIARTADRRMWLKVWVGYGWFLASYAAMGVFPLSPAAFVSVYVLHGVSHMFLLLNIGHDANHNAISRRPAVNRVLSFTMDLCGVNSYMWRILHHKAHHYCINVHARDEAIEGHVLLRFSPDAPHRAFHRWQHLYALPLYGLFSLHYVLVKDFACFFRPDLPLLKAARHHRREYVILFATKAAYVGYMLVVPAFVFGYGAMLTLVAFIAAHAVVGVTTLLVFQTTHLVDQNDFPGNERDFETYPRHVFATTTDVAAGSRWLNLWTGGLNAHVVHHLYPGICHTHYPALTQIVRKTADEYAIPYREMQSLGVALAAHLRLLRRHGRAQPGPLPRRVLGS